MLMSILIMLLAMLFGVPVTPPSPPPVTVNPQWLSDPEPLSVEEMRNAVEPGDCLAVIETDNPDLMAVYVEPVCDGAPQLELEWNQTWPRDVDFAAMSFADQTEQGRALHLGAYTASMCTNECTEWEVELAAMRLAIAEDDPEGFLVFWLRPDYFEPGELESYVRRVEVGP